MHFEVLVEDESGKDALTILLPKIICEGDTFTVHHYRGVGRLPLGLRSAFDPNKKMLLDQLPRLLQGYAKTFASYPANYRVAVICVCDLDRRCRRDFRLELLALASSIRLCPDIHFCIAEEEAEAWLLGDRQALHAAFGKIKHAAIDAYIPDSICGTWEVLADAVYPGGAKVLAAKPYYEVGRTKCEWARTVPPHMHVDYNRSPSFRYFRDKVRHICQQE